MSRVNGDNATRQDKCVGIIGCGWLGSALAKELINQGCQVSATRSREESVNELSAQGINTHLLLIPTEQGTLNKHRIFDCQQLVIAITPQLRQGRIDYPEKIKQLIQAAEQSNAVKQIILLSSSAIYNGLSGDVTEEVPLVLSADKVQLLHEAEQAALAFAQADGQRCAYVLRLAGLVGESRHPGKFLAGKNKALADGDAAVNLIHQQDAVGLILALLNTNAASGIFNGVSNTKANKREYYQRAAQTLLLPEPVFSIQETKTDTRVVNGDKAQRLLSYQFVYPDLLSWL